jgi:phosphate transport system substrate-binding protein
VVTVLVVATGLGSRPLISAQEASPVAIATYVAGADVGGLSGQVVVDGSSTVWPITVDVAERFGEVAPNVEIEIEISGTGGGFERFCAGESDLQNASRRIEVDERAACEAAGVAYHEFEIAFDGITIVVNPTNDFIDCLTIDQLRRLWGPDSQVRNWSDLEPAWPNEPVDLFGPGSASGTFDYFTAAIMGEEGASRTDYTPSENDLVLVEEVAADPYALGYFGFAYYAETQDRLRAVAIDGGAGCVTPTLATIADRTYRPLSRPLFVYVRDSSLDRPEVREFMRFYLALAKEAVASVGYVPVEDAVYVSNQDALERRLGD